MPNEADAAVRQLDVERFLVDALEAAAPEDATDPIAAWTVADATASIPAPRSSRAITSA
jgi:hypothetical protein